LVANSIIFPAPKNYLSGIGAPFDFTAESIKRVLKLGTLHDSLEHDIAQATALSNVPHKEDARDTSVVTQASSVMRAQ
jgi:hypothetical protein